MANQTNQISNFKLKASYWYVTHKLQLKKGLIIFLIVLSIGFFSYSIYSATMILFVYDQVFQQTIASLPVNLIDYQYFRQKNKPLALQLSGPDVIKGTENHYDFVVKLSNPNEKWLVTNALVQLVDNNAVVAEKNSFIYPGQAKYVIFFNQENVNPTTSRIRLAQVSWRRYLKFADFAQPRLNFEISDIKFKSARESGLGEKLPVSSLSFKIKNATAYSYWRVGIYMVLLSTQKVGGANYLSLDQFRSGEIRTIEMRWYESLPPIYDIEIVPEVDILDSASYMPVE